MGRGMAVAKMGKTPSLVTRTRATILVHTHTRAAIRQLWWSRYTPNHTKLHTDLRDMFTEDTSELNKQAT